MVLGKSGTMASHSVLGVEEAMVRWSCWRRKRLLLVVLVRGRAAETRGDVEEERRRRREAIGASLQDLYIRAKNEAKEKGKKEGGKTA